MILINKKIAMIEKIDISIRYLIYFLVILLPFSNSGVEICIGLTLALWIIKHLHLKSFKFERSIINGPIYIFIFIGIISVTGSIYLKESLRAFFSKFMEGIFLYFLMVETVKEKKHAFIIIGLFLLVAVVVSIDGVIQYFFTGIDLFRQRPIVREGVTAAFDYPNKFAGYLFFPLFIILGIAIDRFKVEGINFKTVGLFFAIGLLFFVFIFTKSRAAFLAFLIAMLSFIFYINRKVFLITTILVAAIILLLFFLAVSNPSFRIFRVEQVPIKDTAIIRIHIWQDTVDMIKDRPLFGHGINTYMRLFQKYRRDPSQHPTYTHNCYLQLAAEVGLAGLIVFLWIIARFFQYGLSKRDDYVLLGMIGGLFAFLVHSFFDTNLYSLQLNILFWFMLGLAAAKKGLIDA